MQTIVESITQSFKKLPSGPNVAVDAKVTD